MKPYYQEGGFTIFHGDCREILPALGMFDLLLTDPPYGIQQDSDRAASRSKPFGSAGAKKIAGTKDYGEWDWDVAPPEAEVFAMLARHAKHRIIFGGNYFPLPPSRCWLVWDKDNGNSHYADCELAWTNLDKAVRKFRWRWNGMLQEDMSRKENRVHPTQKPLSLMKWAITQAPDDVASIVDPYMGSGTTLVAAKALGIPCTGIELEERYCEMAARRLAQGVLEFAAVTGVDEL